MNNEIHDQIIEMYDEYVAASGPDPVKLSEARDELLPKVADLLRGTDRDFQAEASMLWANTMAPARQKRSRSLKAQLDYVLDGLVEDGVYVDPLLDKAFPLGDEHGLDKALRFWTAENFRDLVVTRYRVAADSTKAAAELDEQAQRITARMVAAGAEHFGDVDWSTP